MSPAELNQLFKTYDTYVCLLSDHLLPNVIPAVQTKPQRAILLYTPRSKDGVDRFKDVVASTSVQVLGKQVKPYQYAQTQAICEEILGEFPSAMLNVTAGTKIMALAAFDTFRQHRLPILYVDTDNQRIQYLHSGKSESLGDPLTVKQYLACYGYTMQTINHQYNLPQSWRNLEELLVTQSKPLHKALSRLNWIAAHQQKRFSLTSPELADALLKAGLIESNHNASYQFTSEDAGRFINGGWFEHYIYSLLRQIQTQYPIKNLMANIKITNGHVSNELDIVFLYKNKLHIIECKTRHFTESGAVDSTSPIYKIDSLSKQVAGIKGKSMFASYYPLTDAPKKRCRNNGIVCSDQPSQLLKHLRQWIGS